MIKKWSLIFLFAFLSISINSLGQNIIPHPVPEEFVSDHYKVTVNGQVIQVFHAGLNVYFASFDFTGKADLNISTGNENAKYAGQTSNKENQNGYLKGFWKGNAQVRPLSRNIISKTAGSTVTFSIIEAGQYSVERPGTNNFKDEVLFVFANRPGKSIVTSGDSSVICLKPGIHQQHINLKSGQTLYIAPGAVLFGSINIWDAKDVNVTGNGVVLYYGPQSEDHDDGWKNQKNWHPLTTNNVAGLKVSGITFICRSRTWSLQLHTTYDAFFDNVKVIAVNPQNINGDGFDWYGGGRAKISNCFVRSMDDCFAFFTPDASKDMWALNNDTEGEVKDIEIENCVLWTTLANIYRVGFNGQALKTNNIVIKNSDVIHISKGEWYAPWSAICAVSPNNKGKARHSNYLFENIRFEEPAALLGLQNEQAEFQNIVFKNITMAGNPVPSLVKCKLEGLTFDNVKLNGKLVLNKTDVPFKFSSGAIKNMHFSNPK